jgi:uncharacterized protein GlcG (DUF336 family)
MKMNLDLAKRLIDSAVRSARKMNIHCSVAIVDENGWLVALHRMNGAVIPNVDIARDKAWTAAVFRLPSSEVSKFGDPLQLGFGLNKQNWNDRLTTIAGGLPIKDGDDVIGGIGVSGGTPEQDVAVCQAAIVENLS